MSTNNEPALELDYARPKYSPFASVTKPDENGNRRLFCLACDWTQPIDHTNPIRALNEARRLHPETDCKRKP